jgi:hypothetical protein
VPPTVTATPNPTALFLEGTYTTTISSDDLAKKGYTPADTCENAGTFTLGLTAARWKFSQVGLPRCVVHEPFHSGQWNLSGEQIDFTEPGVGCGESFTYKWEWDGQALKFSVVDDSCRQRIDILTAHPWIKQK